MVTHSENWSCLEVQELHALCMCMCVWVGGGELSAADVFSSCMCMADVMSKQQVCHTLLHICIWQRQENTSATEVNTAGFKELNEMDRPLNVLVYGTWACFDIRNCAAYHGGQVTVLYSQCQMDAFRIYNEAIKKRVCQFPAMLCSTGKQLSELSG